MPERPRQLDLNRAGQKELSPTDLSPLLEAINYSNSPVVVYFDGKKGMEESYRAIVGQLQTPGGVVAWHHYHQLLFPDNYEMQQRLEAMGYLPSPLTKTQNGHCVSIVTDVYDFDASQMKKPLQRMNEASNITWVLLVPVWQTTGYYAPLEEWAQATGAHRFRVEAQGV